MTIDQYILFYVLAFVSEIIGTVSGFGSSILFVPLASMFFHFEEVLAITAVFHVFSNLSKIYIFKKGIDWSITYKLGIPAVIFVMLGAWFTKILPALEAELIMSCSLVVLSIFLMIKLDKKVEQTNTNLLVGGMASGFLAGLTGTGGAIRGLVLTAFSLSKEVFIATSAFIDLGVDSARAFLYISFGYLESHLYILLLGLIVISGLGSYCGKWVLHYTSEKVFRYLVLIIILITASVQVYKILLKA